MTKEKQLIAIAELDGLHSFVESTTKFTALMEPCCDICGKHPHYYPHYIPPYLTSHDAIIPVIEKVISTVDLAQHFLSNLDICKTDWTPSPTVNQIKTICAAPSQLAEALLRACGKWEE